MPKKRKILPCPKHFNSILCCTANQQTLCHFKLDFMPKKRKILPCPTVYFVRTANQQTLCHFKLDFMPKKRNILPCLKNFNSILCAFWTTSLPFTDNRFDNGQLQVQNTSDKVVHKVVHKVVLYYMCRIEWGRAHPAAIHFNGGLLSFNEDNTQQHSHELVKKII